MHDDAKFDEFLRQAAKDYQAPAAPPADAIWAAIEPEVAKAIAPKTRALGVRRTTVWAGLGIAATLMIGVAVGRWTVRPTVAPRATVAAAPVATDSNSHAHAITMEHLADAEVFLTAVRAELKSGRTDAERAERSRELLVRTRVLLGSSPNRTPAMERLLEDLELLLAEIAAASPSRSPLDRTILDESMRDGNIIPRIRATLPAMSAGA